MEYEHVINSRDKHRVHKVQMVVLAFKTLAFVVFGVEFDNQSVSVYPRVIVTG